MTRSVEIIQDIAEETHDVVTPSNIMSTVGFVMAVRGASQMDTPKGVAIMGIGRAIDVLDGKVARSTDTASDLGEMVDATLDKTAVAIMCYQAVRKNVVPKSVIGMIAAQNAVNAALSLYDRNQHPGDPHIHPSKDGKHTMFAQNAALGLFCLAEIVNQPGIKKGLRSLGWTAGAIAAYKGARATKGYYNQVNSD